MQSHSEIEHKSPRIKVKRDQPRVRTNNGTGAIWLGIAAIVFGIIMIVMAWSSAHGGTPRPIAALALFGFNFILCGLLLAGYTLKGIRLRRRFREAGGHAPWRFDNLWNQQSADDGVGQRMRNNIFAVSGIAFFLVPFHIILLKDSTDFSRWIFFLFLAFSDVIIFFAVGRIFYLLFHRLVFGRNRIIFGQFPYYTGQVLRLTFSGNSRLSSRQGLKAVLHCIKEYYESHGSGRNRTITPVMESVWRAECTFNTNSAAFAELAFDLPLNLPGTDLIGDPDKKVPHYWELEITAKDPAINYEGLFLIPVYSAAGSTAVHEDRLDLSKEDKDSSERIEGEKKISIAIMLFFSLFLLAGCFSFIQITKRVVRNNNLVHYGMRGTGTVVDYKYMSGDSGRSIWPVVTFLTPDGKSVTFESLYRPNYTGYVPGQRVPVVYDTKDPQTAEIDQPERLWGGVAKDYVVSAIFAVIGGGPIIFIWKRVWGNRARQVHRI